LDLRDRDLISIQQARDLVVRAATAQKEFAPFSQEQVDAVVEACAAAAGAAAEELARLAVEETDFGNVADKTTKNFLGSIHVARAIRGVRTVGILREDRDKGILEVATPVGVVAAVVPSTNPTSTAIYKTLISLKARNAIVLSPHPSALRSICETASVLARAAITAGAPEGLIGCMQHTTLAGTRELMGHKDIGVILATGGTGLVRAAYGSGKPAYGVGPGNVPAYIERSADVRKAVADIFAGKTFDYGTICSSEQAMVVEEPLREAALEESRRQGAYFLSPEESRKVGLLVFQPGTHTPNTSVVGRPATAIAERAGLSVPPETRVLIAQLEPRQVGREFPLSAEKLSPILAFYVVADLDAGIELCRRLLEFGGLGHTCAIHSRDEAAIRRFGEGVPAFRVCVNTAAVHGSIGYSTNLFPAMTLGCGALGGNITSDNIGPLHLMNLKRIAWESRPVEHRTVPAEMRLAGKARAEASGVSANTAVTPSASVSASGCGRSLQGAAPAALPSGVPSPSEIAAAIAGRLFAGQAGAGLASSMSSSAQAEPLPASGASPAPPQAAPAIPAAAVSPFVSESDVRLAISRREKIVIGPRTIVTPSARDLGTAHEVFVETEGS
jgi:acetaldehyde dehydrogenase (acetylating)